MLASMRLNVKITPMSAEHVKVFDGPEDLGTAAEYILTTEDDIDFVVVPGFEDRTSGVMFLDNDEAQKAISELAEVEDAIHQWWLDNALPGLTFPSEVLWPGFGVFTNVMAHLDGPQIICTDKGPTPSYLGPLTGTIMHRHNPETTKSIFSAESIGIPFVPNEGADWEDYQQVYLETVFEGGERNSRPLRSRHEQRKGEILFFRNIPWPTMHRVELITEDNVRPQRLAQVITAHLIEA